MTKTRVHWELEEANRSTGEWKSLGESFLSYSNAKERRQDFDRAGLPRQLRIVEVFTETRRVPIAEEAS